MKIVAFWQIKFRTFLYSFNFSDHQNGLLLLIVYPYLLTKNISSVSIARPSNLFSKTTTQNLNQVWLTESSNGIIIFSSNAAKELFAINPFVPSSTFL